MSKNENPNFATKPMLPSIRYLFTSYLIAFASVSVIGQRVSAQATPRAIVIETAKQTPLELRARDQLLGIIGRWQLDKWIFTRRVRIETGVTPHSHPVLTVNTQYVGNDTLQVATFVHEQLHWFFDARASKTDSAIAELATLFPDAPSGPPEGARDRYSTYLHLLVCLSEFNALRELFGESVARRVLSTWTHYPWVYREVLARPERLQQVLERFALERPDARSQS